MKTIAHFKEALRGGQNSPQPFVRLAVRLAHAVYTCIKAPARFCVNGTYRSAVLLRIFNPRELHQSTVLTSMDRYPKLFAVCRDYFAGNTDLRILSYGCATGEEVLTLRSYFPSAVIVGAEINRHSLAQCRKHKVDDRIVFMESHPDKLRELEPFDAIFCLAVLQRTPVLIAARQTMDLNDIYPFDKFDKKVTELDSWLKKNGLLVVHHAQYLIANAPVASKYAPLDAAKNIRSNNPLFDRNGMRLSKISTNYSVFVKTRE